MAQTNYTPIQLYYSSTASAVPVNTNLASGELAINITDGKLFYKDNAGAVQTLATKAATSGTFATTTISTSETLSYGTANGVAYLNGSKVLTTGSALVFDGSNLGLGVTPSAWRTSFSTRAIQVGLVGSLSSLQASTTNNQTYLTSNAYLAASDWIYQFSDYATQYRQYAGQHNWFTSALGTAGNAITFTQAMTLDASGNLGVGTSSPAYKLDVNGTARFNNTFDFGGGQSITSGSGSYRAAKFGAASGAYNVLFSGSTALSINDNADTINLLVLTNGGNLGLGVTPSAWSGSYKAGTLNLAGGNSLASESSNQYDMIYNAYLTTASGWVRVNADYASIFQQSGGAFTWYNAASGAAGSAVSFSAKMTLTADGNLGVGVTTVLGRAQFNVSDTSTTMLNNAALYLSNTGTATTNQRVDLGFRWQDGTYNGSSAISAIRESGTNRLTAFVFCPSDSSGNPVERVRIDSSGNLLVGTTNSSGTIGAGFKVLGGRPVTVNADTANTTTVYEVYSTGAAAYRFYVGMGGTVYATSTTITAISDQRLKENIRDLDDGLASVMALNPRKFDWKEGKGANIKDARGFIAQEFETVFPDMIEEWRDPAPEGEEPYKAINANLIPTLVKAIQEQQAIIQSLTDRITALEGA